jgi:hypothetical protein
MRIVILFPVDSRKPGKGFRGEVFVIPRDIVRSMFETYMQTRNISRAVDEPCEWVVYEAAKRWCRSMGRSKDEACIDEYLDRQGERIRQQCYPAVRQWIMEVAECLKECGRDGECLKRCLKV